MAGAAPVDFLSSEDWGRENYVLAFANKLPLTLVADPSGPRNGEGKKLTKHAHMTHQSNSSACFLDQVSSSTKFFNLGTSS